MATTNLNVRVDENLKKTADTLLNELGLNMSTAINIYLKQIVRRTAYRLKSNLISQMQKPCRLCRMSGRAKIFTVLLVL